MPPLNGFRIVSLAINLPGPVAAARLHAFGARVTKIEPPSGDPLAYASKEWYDTLTSGMKILVLDLKVPEEQARLDTELKTADLLITSNRPAALERLGLGWEQLHHRYPRLCHVAIVGYPPPKAHLAGHDLTYQAELGLVLPPHLPRALVPDMAGAERAVSASFAVLLARERGEGAGYQMVSLAEAGRAFAKTLRLGMTAPGGILGGGLPNYNIYPAKQGYIAVAALEPHFHHRLLEALGMTAATYEQFAEVFLTRTAEEWENWADEHSVPLAAVSEEETDV